MRHSKKPKRKLKRKEIIQILEEYADDWERHELCYEDDPFNQGQHDGSMRAKRMCAASIRSLVDEIKEGKKEWRP